MHAGGTQFSQKRQIQKGSRNFINGKQKRSLTLRQVTHSTDLLLLVTLPMQAEYGKIVGQFIMR